MSHFGEAGRCTEPVEVWAGFAIDSMDLFSYRNWFFYLVWGATSFQATT